MASSDDDDRAGRNGLPDDSTGDHRNDGESEHGGNDGVVAVSTGIAANVGESSATFEGSLDELAGAGVAVGFEYRRAGDDEWTSTPTRIRSASTTYERTVEELAPGTDYEFRAVAYAGDAVATGGTARFRTDAVQAGPLVDRFEVSDSAFPNPHAELTVGWTVAAGDVDLSSVLVKVVDVDGFVADATRSDASGDLASGVDHFRIANAGGSPLEVKLTVADSDGETTTAAIGLDDTHE